MDHGIKLKTSIREANVQKQHMKAIFVDLAKANKITWKFGIMKDLHSLGQRGRLPNFMESFLSDRLIKVRIGSVFSNLYKQEEGVPQGSILSVTLFNIEMKSITRCITPGIGDYLYVDYIGITSRWKYMRTAERQLQQCINKITHWANTNWFKISKSKMRCVLFLSFEKNAQWPIHKTRRHRNICR